MTLPSSVQLVLSIWQPPRAFLDESPVRARHGIALANDRAEQVNERERADHALAPTPLGIGLCGEFVRPLHRRLKTAHADAAVAPRPLHHEVVQDIVERACLRARRTPVGNEELR